VAGSLIGVLEILKEHEIELRKLVLIDLRPIGVFGYARLKLCIDELLGRACDVVKSRKLKPLLRDEILRESVNAF
jgi:predicted nucleotidyltransferase